MNRYRFPARKGQRLVFSTQARHLIPYIADAVPGWFQPVLVLSDATGKEVAYNDDYRFKPDPTIFYEVPKDGDYVLSIYDGIYRGREDFVYRITAGELPFVTSIFPLGGKAGDRVAIGMKGWNLDGAHSQPPAPNSGTWRVSTVAANRGRIRHDQPRAVRPGHPAGSSSKRSRTTIRSTREKLTLPIMINGRDRPPGRLDE